jgi:hypothetical protein
MLNAEDKYVLCSMLSSATDAESGSHRADPSLEKKSIKAIYSHSQLLSLRALWLPKPLMKLEDISPQGGFYQVWVGRALY